MDQAPLHDLRPVAARVVVVNAGTDLVSLRAVASACRRTALPVLLVNCDPDEASRRRVEVLSAKYDFDVVETERQWHGPLLDRLFSRARDDVLVLLDSDAEICDDRITDELLVSFDEPDVFGAGFTQGPYWLDEAWTGPGMLFMERPWVPFVALRVAPVKQALGAGWHFGERSVPNEVGFSRRLSRLLAMRFPPLLGQPSRAYLRLPQVVRMWLRRRPLRWLAWTRREIGGERPRVAFYDTGGVLYEHLRSDQHLRFVGPDVREIGGRIHHYGGVTRNAVFGARGQDVGEAEIADEVRARLATEYGIDDVP